MDQAALGDLFTVIQASAISRDSMAGMENRALATGSVAGGESGRERYDRVAVECPACGSARTHLIALGLGVC